MYEFGSTVKVPNAALDPLAHITISRYNESVVWQSSGEMIGNKPLKQVLRDCHDQLHGIVSCEDREAIEALGVNAYVNLTQMKTGVVQSFFQDTLNQPGAIPFLLEPTPIPDLSERGMEEALELFKEQVYGNPEWFLTYSSGDELAVLSLARSVKKMVMDSEKDMAKKAINSMSLLMADQLAEGCWNTALNDFATNFTVYPYAVLHGPVPARTPQMSWSGDRAVYKPNNHYQFRSISPFDFWYTPDSPDAQRGTGVFIRQRWTRRNLLEAARMPSYDRENIEKVLSECDREGYNLKWMSDNPDQPDDQLIMWAHSTATIDALVHYGYFSGRELMDYGLTGLNDIDYYNACITVVGGYTVQAVVNPRMDIRPVFTASFHKTHDRIPGYGIPQMIRDVERCYLTILRYAMRNAANASEPIVEADYARLSKFMTDDDLMKLVPGMVYLSDSEVSPAMQQYPAMRFNSIPSNLPQYMNILTYFMDLCDKVSNVPAALHGTAQGTGANRTFRGAAMLQSNAIRSLQSAVSNIDMSVFGPLAELLYNYNLMYEKDDSIKGDCRVVAQGVQGLMQKEIDRQSAFEILQLVGAAGAQMGQYLHPGVMLWALNRLLGTLDIPEELQLKLSDVGARQEAAAGQGGMGVDPTAAAQPAEMQPMGGIQ